MPTEPRRTVAVSVRAGRKPLPLADSGFHLHTPRGVEPPAKTPDNRASNEQRYDNERRPTDETVPQETATPRTQPQNHSKDTPGA